MNPIRKGKDDIRKFSNGVRGWLSKRLELGREKSVLLAGKKWSSFPKVFRSVWIVFDRVKRVLNFLLRRLIANPANRSNWQTPLRATGLGSFARSVSIDVTFQGESGVIAG
jgi:hypothetical protein